jgi:hypothetical protein
MKAKLVLFSCAVAAALLLCEFAVRLLGLAPRVITLPFDGKDTGYRSSDNPVLGYEPIPNQRNPRADLHYGNFPETNSRGLRDVERAVDKPAGTRRIIVLGDSVVAGHGIWDLRDTIPGQLERSLGQRGPTEVLNFGVGGYQTLAEVELLKTRGLDYSPDVVVLVFDNSDFEPQNFNIGIPDPLLREPVKRLFKISHLFRLIVLKADPFGLRFRMDTDYRLKAHRRLVKDSVEGALADLKRLSEERGFDLLIVIWPRFGNDVRPLLTGEEIYPGEEEAGKLRRILEICSRDALPCQPLAPYFAQDYNRMAAESGQYWSFSPNQVYTIGDTAHPNKFGARGAAAMIEALLREKKLL